MSGEKLYLMMGFIYFALGITNLINLIYFSTSVFSTSLVIVALIACVVMTFVSFATYFMKVNNN